MRTLEVSGELSAQDLEAALDTAGGKDEAGTAYAIGDVRVTVLIGEKYYLRTNTRMGVAVVAASNGQTQRVDVLRVGGAEGILGIELGAGGSIEEKVFESLGALAAQRGLQVRRSDQSA